MRGQNVAWSKWRRDYLLLYAVVNCQRHRAGNEWTNLIASSGVRRQAAANQRRRRTSLRTRAHIGHRAGSGYRLCCGK
jgi:hypothetical protein